jgi:hypothetical protein
MDVLPTIPLPTTITFNDTALDDRHAARSGDLQRASENLAHGEQCSRPPTAASLGSLAVSLRVCCELVYHPYPSPWLPVSLPPLGVCAVSQGRRRKETAETARIGNGKPAVAEAALGERGRRAEKVQAKRSALKDVQSHCMQSERSTVSHKHAATRMHARTPRARLTTLGMRTAGMPPAPSRPDPLSSPLLPCPPSVAPFPFLSLVCLFPLLSSPLSFATGRDRAQECKQRRTCLEFM